MLIHTYTKICLITFTAILLLSSCNDPIEINSGASSTQLVVEGNVTFDPLDSLKLNSKDTVILTTTAPYTSNSTPPIVGDAFLTITDLITNQIDTLKNIGNGRYITQKLIPRIGAVLNIPTYRLDILLANGEKYYATTTINRKVDFRKLTSIDTIRTVGPGGPIAAGGYVKMEAYDLPGAGDSYRFKFFVKRKQVSENPYATLVGWNLFNSVSDLVIATESLNGDNGPVEGIEQGGRFILPITVRPNTVQGRIANKPAYYPGDSIRIQICSITKEHLFFYYRFIQELENGTGGGTAGLFARPVANVPSNIQSTEGNPKKALGFFGGYSVVTREIEMIDFPTPEGGWK